MFKKEDNIKYFVGGTAVGMAAGLIVGKLMLPSLSTLMTQNNEPDASTKRTINERSQDDNIFNSLYSNRKDHCCLPRSKSASRYKDKISNNVSSPAIPLQKLRSDPTDKINNLSLGQKSKTHLNNISQSDRNQPCNISIENNIAYESCEGDNNVFYECYTDQSEKGKNSNRELPKCGNLKNLTEFTIPCPSRSNFTQCNISLPTVLSSTYPKEINIENLNVSGKQNAVKQSEISKNLDLPIVFKNLSSNFNVDKSTVMNNIDKLRMSTINSYIFGNGTEDVTNAATCNTNLDIGDEGEAGTAHFTSFDEFQEVDLISSTKRDNSDDV